MIDLKVITNRKLCPGEDVIGRLKYLVKNSHKSYGNSIFNMEAVILREKDLEIQFYERLLKEASELFSGTSIELYAHSHWKTAIDLDIKNIHMPFSHFNKICEAPKDKNDFLQGFQKIGISVHSLEEALICESEGVDYVLYSHIFPTECKKYMKPKGLKSLNDITKKVIIPVYALGGIRADNAHLAVEAGAKGVAIMSKFMEE